MNEQIGIRYNNLETMFGNIGKNDFTNIINQNHINDFSAFITNLKNEFNAFVQNKRSQKQSITLMTLWVINNIILLKSDEK